MKWILFAATVACVSAQDVRPVGVIEKIDLPGGKIVLKTDSGAPLDVQVTEATTVVKIKPGERDLKNATPLAVSDLSTGDRILVRGTIAEDRKSIPAAQIIVMTQGELASRRSAEQAAWAKGVFGTVKSVDKPGNRIELELRSGMPGAEPKLAQVTLSGNTVVRRYAPDSVKFADAVPAALSDIRAGDQVRARGQKSADGLTVTADEVVAGSFRNIAATILTIDAEAKSMTVTDLDAKKPLTVKLSADSSIRKMPQMMAQFMAMRLNAGEGGAAVPGARGAAPAASGTPGAQAMAGRPQGGPGMGGPGMGGGAPNPAQMLERMPAATLADLKPGDALIIASTEGRSGDQVTAITVLAGVEPILTVPSKNRQMMMGGWNLDMNPSMGMGMQ